MTRERSSIHWFTPQMGCSEQQSELGHTEARSPFLWVSHMCEWQRPNGYPPLLAQAAGLKVGQPGTEWAPKRATVLLALLYLLYYQVPCSPLSLLPLDTEKWGMLFSGEKVIIISSGSPLSVPGLLSREHALNCCLDQIFALAAKIPNRILTSHVDVGEHPWCGKS